ncbi:actin interacting protein 3-domain-containing protein [Rhizopus microsporus]
MCHLPNELYVCLKNTLSKPPSSEALEQDLPTIKDSILKLLHGIKKKQAILRERREPKVLSPIQIDLTDPTSKQAVDRLTSQDDLTESSKCINNKQDSALPLYLKKGSRIKKATIRSQDLILSNLRQLFERHYNMLVPESVIYILDPCSGVEYELENVDDVKPYSILSIKGMSDHQPLLDEMKDTLEKIVEQALKTWLNKQTTSDEVQSLRQQLHATRQAYESCKQKLENQAQDLSSETAKAEMDEGKEITQTAAYLVTSHLEALQDNVDQLKHDITQKRCRPSKNRLQQCLDESKLLEKEMEDLEACLRTYKPQWKKTWETTLQAIVKEQKFLKDQENLLIDLKEDHRAILDVLEQATKIAEIHERTKQQSSTPEFRVAPAEEGFEGMASVMKEVSAIRVDHDRRLRALDQAEKMRTKALGQSIDAFERELTNFVGLKKLKRTGGADAVDKQREEKDRAIMKQMFTCI